MDHSGHGVLHFPTGLNRVYFRKESDLPMETPLTWAILIGVDFYRSKKNLRGATRDVKDLEIYLQETKKDSLRLSTFTAHPPRDPPTKEASENPIGDPLRWPTYENIISKLDEITENANPRDIVYIHFSGHGTREPPADDQPEKYNDIALSLFDVRLGERYLYGVDLATHLESIAERGLSITVTLDCCFSGSITRGPPGHAREVDWDHHVAASYPPINHRLSSNGTSVLRNAHWSFDWLKKSSKVTIITACAPHEKALELEDVNKIAHGALSYYLVQSLEALRKNNREINVQSLYTRLCMRFRADRNLQTPMLLGKRDSSFIGDICPPTPVYIGISKVDGALRLQAGRGHGICKDDEFDAYVLAPSISDFDPSSGPIPKRLRPIRVKATSVAGLESIVTTIGSTTDHSLIRTGWVAKPLKRFSQQSIYVELIDADSRHSQLIAALEASSKIRICEKSAGLARLHVVQLKVTVQGEYEIRDCFGQPLPGLHTIPMNDKDSALRTVEIIEKVAACKILELWENEDPSQNLEAAFSITFESSQSKDSLRKALEPDDTGLIRIADGYTLHLILHNGFSQALYFHVYNIQPEWRIEGLFPKGGGADYYCLQPKNETRKESGSKRIPLQVSIPDKWAGRGECEDVLKIFVTFKATSFAIHQMEALPTPKDAKRGPPLQLEDDWTTRTYRFCLIPSSIEMNA
jgi:hypothetical protein